MLVKEDQARRLTDCCYCHSLPLSFHSYQESGRAGRDGDQADCILYYAYKDKKTLENMIRKSAPDPYSPSTRRKIDQLYSCVRYCEDEFRCRRTMQLEFFGETFDRKLCRGTCDNCKEGREPDRKDLTAEAKTILKLYNEASRRKKGFGGITLLQLGELYRGATSQSATKGLSEVNKIPGFNEGSKFKKFEIDRILHAMIFDHALQETGQDTKGGFSVDYVNLGDNAQAILQGRRTLMVEFPQPKRAARSKSPNKKKAAPKKTKAKKTTTKVSASKSTTQKKKASAATGTASTRFDGGLQFTEMATADSSDDSSSDDESTLGGKGSGGGKSPKPLPSDHSAMIVKQIKQLTSSWASEEQLMGNKTFCKYSPADIICFVFSDILTCRLFRFYTIDWHILNDATIKSIAAYAPTTKEELASLGLMGEEKIKVYGDRLIRLINHFIDIHGLSDYVGNRPGKRKADDSSEGASNKLKAVVVQPVSSAVRAGKPKARKAIIEISDDDSEFGGDDIDFAAMDIP